MAKAKAKRGTPVEPAPEIQEVASAPDVTQTETSEVTKLLKLERNELDENGKRREGPLTAEVPESELANWLQSDQGWKLAD